MQEVKSSCKSCGEYRETRIRLLDTQFPIEMLDSARNWDKIIDRRDGFMITDYIMRECLQFDDEGITPEIFFILEKYNLK